MSLLRYLPGADQLRTIKFFLARNQISLNSAIILFRYILGIRFNSSQDRDHLNATMQWLARAQDQYGDGVSNVYFFRSGWGIGYPETSGYIIATFLAYADYSGDQSFRARAERIAQWEIDIQAASGGVLSSPDRPETRVFNTGQVMLGWCAIYSRTNEQKYLNAAIRAGNYLVEVQEPDGSWVKDTYCGARTYHARVDWALIRLFNLTGDIRYINAAKKNLQWVIDQSNDKGWFNNCGFNQDLPITHVIEYTLGGLIGSYTEGGQNLAELGMLDLVKLSVKNLTDSIESNSVGGIPGMVPSSFDDNWLGNLKNSCLTGNAQIACLLYRLSHITADLQYKEIADQIIEATKTTQYLGPDLKDIAGGVSGSYPISHGYVPNGFPNWAAKFFADALMMKIKFKQKMDVAA
jgi:Beta-L-arabinofuranosidase, GH127